MMFKKGQVSTEYLVILAVVLVVALIVVALVGGMSPVSTGVSESQSKNYWLSVAPVSISGWKYTGGSMDLTLQNMGGQKVTITRIDIQGIQAFTGNETLAVGETKTVTATGLPACASAASFELQNVTITYTSGSTTGLLEKGDKPMVGKCS